MKVTLSFFRQAFNVAKVYRLQFWLQIFANFMAMYGMHFLWGALYARNPGSVGGLTRESVITYGVLSMAMESIMGASPEYYMGALIRTGAVDTELMKPIDFQFQLFARHLGLFCSNLLFFVLPASLLGFWLLDLQPPASAGAGLLFVLSMGLGFLIIFGIGFLLGLLAMITMSIESIRWAYSAVIMFFAGKMVPLWLMPDAVRRVAELLPFQGINYIPVSIYAGQMTGSAAYQGLLVQAIWAVVLLGLGRLGWSRMHARLVVQGG